MKIKTPLIIKAGKTEVDQSISQRITTARYLMICGIVVHHMAPQLELADLGNTPFHILYGFITHALTRFMLPVLTTISGYLFFSYSSNLPYSRVLKKKMDALLLPFFYWNIPIVLVMFILQYTDLNPSLFVYKFYPFDTKTWLNGIFSLTRPPVNYPLNFLRDLYLLFALTPVWSFFLKRLPLTGLALLIAVFRFDFDGHFFLTNTMPVLFYTGGLLAIRKWDLKALDSYWPVSLILMVTACFTVIFFKMEDMFWLKLAAPVLVWPILSLLQNTPAGTFILKHTRHGFCIFLTHALFLFVLDGLYWRFLCNVLPIELYWLSGPLIIIVSCELFDRLVRRCFPEIAPHLFGGR